MKLTQEQINEFNSDGFLLLKNYAKKSVCTKISKVAQEHITTKISPIESEQEYLQQNTNDNITLRRLRQVYNRDQVFEKWMKNPDLAPVFEQLLGEKAVLSLAHHNSIMTKMPQVSSRTCWHQDIRYWNFENDSLLSVWLALGDEFIENGVLEFIPKSHKMTFETNQFDKQTCFSDTLEENQEIIKTRVHYDLKQGDVILFHAKTLHHANKNSTNKPKISFVYTVRASSNLPIKGTRSDALEIEL
jgi:phytanoyl-CoA hydroxylase